MTSNNPTLLFISRDQALFEELEAIAIDDGLTPLVWKRISRPNETVAEISNGSCQCAILDVSSQKNSVGLVERIKKANPGVPVMALIPSGFHMETELMDAGAEDVWNKSHLNKPLLRQKIKSLIERGRIHEMVEIRGNILEAVNMAAETFLLNPDWGSSIDDVLARLGGATRSDRAYIFGNGQLKEGCLGVWLIAEWSGGEIRSKKALMPPEPYTYEGAGFGRWRRVLAAGEMIHGNV